MGRRGRLGAARHSRARTACLSQPALWIRMRSMSMVPSKLRDEVLRLPVEARARLVDELLHSLDQDDEIDQAEHDAAWGTEIAERLREVDAGESQPVPWRKARQRIMRER
jgi:putative addiction module component (TIGR02574 family)